MVTPDNVLELPSGKEIEIKPDGGLYSVDLYIDWSPGEAITLDGIIDPLDLYVIAEYIRKTEGN